jgi:hypothetical protein
VIVFDDMIRPGKQRKDQGTALDSVAALPAAFIGNRTKGTGFLSQEEYNEGVTQKNILKASKRRFQLLRPTPIFSRILSLWYGKRHQNHQFRFQFLGPGR